MMRPSRMRLGAGGLRRAADAVSWRLVAPPPRARRQLRVSSAPEGSLGERLLPRARSERSPAGGAGKEWRSGHRRSARPEPSGPTAVALAARETGPQSSRSATGTDALPPGAGPDVALLRSSVTRSRDHRRDVATGLPTRTFPLALPPAAEPQPAPPRSFARRIADSVQSRLSGTRVSDERRDAGLVAPPPGAESRRPGLTRPIGDLGSRAAGPAQHRAGDPAVRREVPPPVARAAVEGRFGLDLASVPVYRGPAASATARALGARAFTVEGAVHVPAEAGPLDTGAGKRLLVHELVHVAQQRRLAPEQPAEASALGRSLEAEARTLEHALAPAVESSRHAREPAASLRPATPLPAPAEPPPVVAPPGLQRAAEPAAPQPEAAASEPSIDEIVARLYDRVSSRLKAELLIDRERAGVLNDLR
jgi:Domain of unknown function (DUF4157)